MSSTFSPGFRPDLIDFDKLKKSNAHYNLQNAFNLAEQHLGLTRLLDPEGERTHTHACVLKREAPGSETELT